MLYGLFCIGSGACGVSANNVLSYLYLSVCSQYTMLIGIAIEIPFALGEALLGIEAYFIRDWTTLQIVAYLPLLCKNQVSINLFVRVECVRQRSALRWPLFKVIFFSSSS